MIDQWYCRSKKGEAGPFSRDELRYLLRTGVLPASGEVKCGLKSDWVALQDSDLVSKVAESAKAREQKQDTHGDDIFGAGNDKVSNSPASPPPVAAAMDLATFQSKFLSPDHWIAAIIVAALLLLIAATILLWSSRQPGSPTLGDDQSSVSTASERGYGDDSSTSTGTAQGDQALADSETLQTGTGGPLFPRSWKHDAVWPGKGRCTTGF